MYRINVTIRKSKPVEEYLKIQQRFNDAVNDPEKIKEIQTSVDARWNRLKRWSKSPAQNKNNKGIKALISFLTFCPRSKNLRVK